MNDNLNETYREDNKNLNKSESLATNITTVSKYSHLSNKRGGDAKFAKSLTVEVGINVGFCGKN